MNVLTPDELADKLSITTKKLHELRRKHRWPCLKFGRFDVRFTDAQVDQIVAQMTVAPSTPTHPEPVTVPGQTARSASRKRVS